MNFCQVFLCLVIKVVPNQSKIEPIKADHKFIRYKFDTETTSISIDQKVFQGFKGYNSLKKSELEVEQANLELNKTEQETILDTVSVYFDYIFKTKK